MHAEPLKRGKSVATYQYCPVRLRLSLAPGCTRLYTDTNGKLASLYLAHGTEMATNFAVVVLNFISYVIGLYTWVIIAVVIFSWLVAFNVINSNSDFVRAVWQGLNALTEPLLRPIRRILPDLGGLDISPIILLLGCFFLQQVIGGVLIPAVI